MRYLSKTICLAVTCLLILPTLGVADNQVRKDYTPLPEEKHFEKIPYLNGGFGIDNREDMKEQLDNYNLKLVFANGKGEYLADIDVKIVDEHGRWMLVADSNGPWFYTRLPSGEYTVLANYDRILRMEKANVQSDRQRILNIVW